MFSAPFFFLLPLGHLHASVSIFDVVSEALKPSLFVEFFFFLLFRLGDFTTLSLRCLSVLLYHVIYSWFPPVYFPLQLLYSSPLILFFLIVSDSLLRSSLCSSILHPSLGIIFMIISLNYVSDNLLISLLWGLLMRGCLLSFGKCFSVSSFCWALCVCFYALGRKATCLSLEEVVLYRWLAYSLGPVQVSVISWLFIAVYTARFILDMLLFLRICQDLPVS